MEWIQHETKEYKHDWTAKGNYCIPELWIVFVPKLQGTVELRNSFTSLILLLAATLLVPFKALFGWQVSYPQSGPIQRGIGWIPLLSPKPLGGWILSTSLNPPLEIMHSVNPMNIVPFPLDSTNSIQFHPERKKDLYHLTFEANE